MDQFRLLLQDLENNNAMSIRLQLKRGASSIYFSNVLVFSGDELILSHLASRTIEYIKDLNDVKAFEIDHAHRIFESFKRYIINPKKAMVTDYDLNYGEYSF